jgi:ribosome-associated heat shock protein Hsp15
MNGPTPSREPRQRIDKWLWFARLARSRTQAQRVVVSGGVRINREKIGGASHPVKVGDTLTIGLESGVRVLRILATGTRRGPAAEARLLFEDLSPPAAPRSAAGNETDAGGRPSKRDRRTLTALKRGRGDNFAGGGD